MAQTTILIFFLTLMHGSHGDDPPGHGLPLGSHGNPENKKIPVMSYFPSPGVFYHEFAKPGRPVLFRGVLDNLPDAIPAYQKWTDSYLRDIHGHINVEVEEAKKENRVKGQLWTMKLEEFLKRYNRDDIYMVNDVSGSMKEQVHLPVTLQCGGFQKQMDLVVMWFSSGGTKSHFHNDGLDNINCILDGEKYIFLVNKSNKDIVEGSHFQHNGAFSMVDVDAVDMYKFKDFHKLPWYEVKLSKGDCFFIPYKWYHYVHSLPGRNLAINFWFQHLMWFDEDDPACNEIDVTVNSTKPYPISEITMGGKAKEVRVDLFYGLENKDSVTKDDFMSLFDTTEAKDKQLVNEIFDFLIDTNKDGILQWSEIYATDFGHVIQQYPSLFGLSSEMLQNQDVETEDPKDPEAPEDVFDFESDPNVVILPKSTSDKVLGKDAEHEEL